MAQIHPFSVVQIFLVSCITSFKNIKHYEKSYTGMNVFRKGMNSFRNGMNMFRTGMKTFRIGTGIRGNQNYQKIRNFSGSKNLKEFFQNSKVLKSSYQTKPNLKSWNFEKILSDSWQNSLLVAGDEFLSP